MIKIITILLIFGLLQACVAYPKETFRKDYKRCDLVPREYHLTMNRGGLKMLMQGTGDPLQALVLAGIVASITIVVSGSVVVVGNTIHFLEKQGSCDDSFLNEQVLVYIKPLLSEGGELVTGENPPSSELEKNQYN